MASIAIIQTQDDAPPGLLGDWARRHGVVVAGCRVDRGEAPSALDGFDAAIVLGSSASVNDTALPWVGPLRDWTATALGLGTPMLGICFGAQMMATALGAPVTAMAAPEIGWIDVDTTDAGVGAGPWLSWHNDAIGPSAALRVVAGNPRGIQAFRAGAAGHQLGVQFHPEVTPAIIRDWGRSEGGQSLDAAGTSMRRLERETQRLAAGAADAAAALFDAWGRAAGLV